MVCWVELKTGEELLCVMADALTLFLGYLHCGSGHFLPQLMSFEPGLLSASVLR